MATLNIEQMLEQAKADFVAEVLDTIPTLPTADERLNAIRAVAAEQYDRDSDKLAAVSPLGSDSMIGSYFRAPDPRVPDAEAAWLDGASCAVVEGIVIKQPHTGPDSAIYLVEFYGPHGGTGYQQLVELERMVGQRWAFYDSSAWLSGQQSVPVPATTGEEA